MNSREHHCGPNIDYLRISITDRCNQRCFYCMPKEELKLFEHGQILSYEEIMAVVRAAARLGFSKFRLTGGEPLVRRGVCDLIRQMTTTAGVNEVALTTNGALLETMAPALFAAGLKRLNISLDSLNPIKFQKITGKDHFQRVVRGIERARAVGFSPVKINMVVIRDINDDELEAFARWSIKTGLTVRFIEFMPIGANNGWQWRKVVTAGEIRARLENVIPLKPLARACADGPARRFQLGDTAGEIGLIGALSHHFCATCNRLRLTAEGKLRPCLRRDEEIDVKAALRRGGDENALMDLIRTAVLAKTARAWQHEPALQSCRRAMSRIGG